MPFVPVSEAIEEIRAGRILVVVDDEDRENEGDLTIAAEKVTPEIINFMATHGRGLICLALTPERCDSLRLPLMSPTNTSNFGTAFCESIDARDGVTTGISAADRTRTILQAIDPDCRPADLARPGHIFPLRAREGGVLVRAGQTEASVDLARLAGLKPAGVICEIMNPDGTMARVPQLEEFCERHGLKMISVAELIRYRMKHERFIRRAAEGCIETEFGEFRTVAYTSDLNPEYHLALVRGDLAAHQSQVVFRIQVARVGDRAELAEFRLDAALRGAADEPLVLHAVPDQLRDRNHLQSVALAELLELRNPRHGAVRVHDLADHAGRLEPGERGQIDGRLGLRGAHPHAAFPRAQGKDVAGAGQVRRAAIGVDRLQDGAGAVGGRNTGRHAVARVDRFAEGGAEIGRIRRTHQRQAEGIAPLRRERQADEPAAVGRHEVDDLRRDLLGRDGEVALVFAVLVVHDHEDAAGADLLDGFGNGDEGHSSIVPGMPQRECQSALECRIPDKTAPGFA